MTKFKQFIIYCGKMPIKYMEICIYIFLCIIIKFLSHCNQNIKLHLSHIMVPFFSFLCCVVVCVLCSCRWIVYSWWSPLYLVCINIVLINGCFHNGPVICPRLVIMAQGRLYWPEATPRANTTFRGPLWLNRGHITGPLWKHQFINTILTHRNSKTTYYLELLLYIACHFLF